MAIKPEQGTLLEKAHDSIDAAKLLAGQNYHDFAASRAYYAMFYIAEAFLLSKGLSFSKHSAVISAFGQHFVKSNIVPEEFHRYLIEGQGRRQVGDYDIGPGLSRDQAYEQIEWAEKFLSLAQHLL